MKKPTMPAPPVMNARQRMDGAHLLKSIRPETAALAFFDPQYREVLDKLKYGNEGERQSARAELPQMSPIQIARMVRDLSTALKPGGHLVLWTDKFGAATGKWRNWLTHTIDLAVVDMMAWNAMRFGMGKRLRGTMEYAMILQKFPTSSAAWKDRTIRDGWIEQSDRDLHPHAKPFQLTQALIKATTKRGDLVIDPAAGSYVVLEACLSSGRQFLGCDLA